jgi:hypothetical protein
MRLKRTFSPNKALMVVVAHFELAHHFSIGARGLYGI